MWFGFVGQEPIADVSFAATSGSQASRKLTSSREAATMAGTCARVFSAIAPVPAMHQVRNDSYGCWAKEP